jgi:hypothetical protein
MRKIVTKVDIVVSDDGGECDPTCPFLVITLDSPDGCNAFGAIITDLKRCVGCMAREDVGYQIPVVEE